MSTPEDGLTRQQVYRRLVGSTVAGALIGFGVILLLASDAWFLWLVALGVGAAVGFLVARFIWREEMERYGITGFGEPRSW